MGVRSLVSQLPLTCSIAFKEWQGICNALGDGRQSLILRKGGIAEENGEFRPEHPAFWIYPTHVHEMTQGLRTDRAVIAQASSETVEVDLLAVTTSLAYADRLSQFEAIRDFHEWTDETVEQRFHYRNPGLWVIGVRIYRPDRPLRVPITAEQLGCKTWVKLPEAYSTENCLPVLDESVHAERMQALSELLAQGSR
jgi:hypothetical protein